MGHGLKPADTWACASQEIEGGAQPYIYGGRPGKCSACESEEPVAQQCQFSIAGFGICGWMRGKLTEGYLARGFTEILTFTPCDMWPLVAGRTLFFAGDSQTQARPGWSAGSVQSLVMSSAPN